MSNKNNGNLNNNMGIKNKKTNFFIVFLFLFIVLILSVGLLLVEDNKTSESEIIDIQNYVTLATKEDVLNIYDVDLYNVIKDMNKFDEISDLGQYNIKLQFKVNDYNVELRLIDGPYERVVGYELYVNNNKICKDALSFDWMQSVSFSLLGEYLIYKYHFVTDIDKSFDIIYKDKDSIQNIFIHDLEDIEGMKIRNIDLSINGIVVTGTRITHGPSIKYENEYYEILTGEECQNVKKQLPNDLILESTYTYTYENGIINLSPVITDKVTFEEYISQNDSVCTN